MAYFRDLSDRLASDSRTDGIMPDPEQGIGRECYAFSPIEDRLIENLEQEALTILDKLPSDCYAINRDAVGNLFIRLHGFDPSAKKVMTGSHIDSVRNGGMYDGVLGIVAGMDLLKQIVDSGVQPKNDFVVVAFRAEESSPKTGNAYLASAIATGTISEQELEAISYRLDDGRVIPFKIYFNLKYGPDVWNAILHELENPPIRPQDILLFEELHIEQSSVIQSQNSQVGVVMGGVGGSERMEFNGNEPLKGERIETDEYQGYQVTITGERGHTGGTPMNSTANVEDGENYYRSDAIVGGAYFTNLLLSRCQKSGIDVRINAANVEEDLGFTTIPPKFTIRLACDKDSFDRFNDIFEEVKEETSRKKRVNVCGNFIATAGKEALYKEEVWEVFSSVFHVEYAARKINVERGGLGTVRSTIVDLKLVPGAPVSFKIDLREVMRKDGAELSKEVRGIVEDLRGKVRDIAYSRSEVLDDQVADFTQSIADELGLSYVRMPSVPGHDAVSLSKIGVKTGMIFVKHDGVSHSPKEHVEDEDVENALMLYRELLSRYLAK